MKPNQAARGENGMTAPTMDAGDGRCSEKCRRPAPQGDCFERCRLFGIVRHNHPFVSASRVASDRFQNPEPLKCPICSSTMIALLQLDWGHLIWGEGIRYVQWCDTCAVSGLTFQQT